MEQGPPWMDGLPPIEDICRMFQLGEFTGRWRRLGGSFNVNIKFHTDQRRYVLRVLNNSITAEHLRYLMQVLSEITKQGVPAPIPLLSADGECFMEDSRGSLLQVLPYMSAKEFVCREPQVFSSARMLRTFHQALALKKPGPPPGITFFPENDYFLDALSKLKTFSGISKFGLAEAEEAAAEILQNWELAASQLPSTIIHGDWHFWNQLYSEEDEVSCVLDFDFLRHGPRILDVAYSLWTIYVLLPSHADRLIPLFLQGYGKLEDGEKANLPYAIARTALFFLCHSAASSTPPEKWERQYAKQMPLIRWLLSRRNSLPEYE